jgi:hypothetical protein
VGLGSQFVEVINAKSINGGSEEFAILFNYLAQKSSYGRFYALFYLYPDHQGRRIRPCGICIFSIFFGDTNSFDHNSTAPPSLIRQLEQFPSQIKYQEQKRKTD